MPQTAQAPHEPTFILDEVEVVSAERISPSFVRLELGGPAMADLGVADRFWDQRIKLVLPNAAGRLPELSAYDESWWESWLQVPEEERGSMRTYTVRAVRGSGAGTRMVVDIVLHADGEAGPGARWAAQAAPGDRVLTIAPRRGHEYGGIEFEPGTARELLIVGDETAVPAICSILEDLDADAVGTAFLEVPETADAVALEPHTAASAPRGVAVHWLPRDGAPLGSRLDERVRAHLGVQDPHATDVDETEVPVDLWETPSYSSSGEVVDEPVAAVRQDLDGCYAWIAGESKVVTGLRRLLVRELGMDRRQVAFMGYWRQGVAMRS